MLERFIQSLHVEDVGEESPPDTRERMKTLFPRNSLRRMTQLGLVVGRALAHVQPKREDPLIYVSSYGETRGLEAYLESFPSPSPTLFQTSIHPCGAQQPLVAWQQPLDEFHAMTGDGDLALRGLVTALLAPASRVLLCGGEEKGTWLLAHRLASPRTFAFALALTREPVGDFYGRISLERRHTTRAASADPAVEALPDFFNRLIARQGWTTPVQQDLELTMEWK